MFHRRDTEATENGGQKTEDGRRTGYRQPITDNNYVTADER